MLAHGTTTVEAKSGYGLTEETSSGALALLSRLADRAGPAGVVPTLLAAHEIPPEFRDDRGEWVRAIVEDDPAARRGGRARPLLRRLLRGGRLHGRRVPRDPRGRARAAGSACASTPTSWRARAAPSSPRSCRGRVRRPSPPHRRGGDPRARPRGTVAVLLPGTAWWMRSRPRAGARPDRARRARRGRLRTPTRAPATPIAPRRRRARVPRLGTLRRRDADRDDPQRRRVARPRRGDRVARGRQVGGRRPPRRPRRPAPRLSLGRQPRRRRRPARPRGVDANP